MGGWAVPSRVGVACRAPTDLRGWRPRWLPRGVAPAMSTRGHMDAPGPAVPRTRSPPGVRGLVSGGLESVRGQSACLHPPSTLSPADGGTQPGPVPKSLQKQRRVLERLVSSECEYGRRPPPAASAVASRPPQWAHVHAPLWRPGLGPRGLGHEGVSVHCIWGGGLGVRSGRWCWSLPLGSAHRIGETGVGGGPQHEGPPGQKRGARPLPGCLSHQQGPGGRWPSTCCIL